MTDKTPVITKFIGGYTKRTLYKLEYHKDDRAEYGIASIHESLSEAKATLKQYKEKQNAG